MKTEFEYIQLPGVRESKEDFTFSVSSLRKFFKTHNEQVEQKIFPLNTKKPKEEYLKLIETEYLSKKDKVLVPDAYTLFKIQFSDTIVDKY